MTLRDYLLRRCACCGFHVPRRTGYLSPYSFEILCDRCYSGCYRHLSPGAAHWVHLGLLRIAPPAGLQGS